MAAQPLIFALCLRKMPRGTTSATREETALIIFVMMSVVTSRYRPDIFPQQAKS